VTLLASRTLLPRQAQAATPQAAAAVSKAPLVHLELLVNPATMEPTVILARMVPLATMHLKTLSTATHTPLASAASQELKVPRGQLVPREPQVLREPLVIRNPEVAVVPRALLVLQDPLASLDILENGEHPVHQAKSCPELAPLAHKDLLDPQEPLALLDLLEPQAKLQQPQPQDPLATPEMLEFQAKTVFPAALASLATTVAMEAATIVHHPGPHPAIKTLSTQLNGPDNDNDTISYEWNPYLAWAFCPIALHLSLLDNIVAIQ
jgi:hypothetical protein